jgi:hypothetical protein
MRKLAIFVEGYSELLFVDNLVREIIGEQHLTIQLHQIRGGSTVPRSISIMRITKATTDEKFYIQIIDCGGDALVKTRILEEHKNLTDAGFEKIIGIRDVRPDFTLAEIPKLRTGLKLYIKTSLAPVEFILAIMEVEAWFLAEVNHFPTINPALNEALIFTSLGFNPANDDLSLRPDPANDLDQAYKLVGEGYDKTRAHIERTVNNLDYSNVYFETSKRFSDLGVLTGSIENFIS